MATELHAELEDVLGAGARSVVVDLADATPVDLTVVGVLLASLRRLNDADGQLVLVAPDDGELRVAHDALRLRDHFRVERTLPAAVAASGRVVHGDRLAPGDPRSRGAGASARRGEPPDRLVRTLRVRNQQLEQALSSRIVIEQAKGVLVERLALTPDEAFELIRTAARRHRITVRELAFEVVTTRQTPAAILAPSRAAS